MAELRTIVTEIGSQPTLWWTVLPLPSSFAVLALTAGSHSGTLEAGAGGFLMSLFVFLKHQKCQKKTAWGEEGTEVEEEQDIL